MLLERRHEVWEGFCNSSLAVVMGIKPKTEKTAQGPKTGAVPAWWYLISLAIAIGVGIFACEYYPVQLHWYGVLLAMIISAVFFIPVRLATIDGSTLANCE